MLKRWVQDLLPLFEKRSVDTHSHEPSQPEAFYGFGQSSSSPVDFSSPPAPRLFDGGKISLSIVHNPKAKRYLLRLNPQGQPVLTIPRRGNEAEGLRFFEKSRPWLERRLQEWRRRSPPVQHWQEGTCFWFRGEQVTLSVTSFSGSKGVVLQFGNETVSIAQPVPDYRPLIVKHLQEVACREIPPRVLELARLHNVIIQRITMRGQRTRWGSCSSKGAISLNWRLIQTPPFVVDYIILHELMHRRQMNHSARFWREVETVYPRYPEAEAWLKKHPLQHLENGSALPSC